MSLLLTREGENGGMELAKDNTEIPFHTFRVGLASNTKTPIRLTLYNVAFDITGKVLLTNEEFVHFILEWMRFNMEFSAPLIQGSFPKTPSDFLKEVENILHNGLRLGKS